MYANLQRTLFTFTHGSTLDQKFKDGTNCTFYDEIAREEKNKEKMDLRKSLKIQNPKLKVCPTVGK